MADSQLLHKIHNIIRDKGPIPVDTYMNLCLADEDFGYYKTRDPFGKEGDFITAPDISQMFGELLAIWCIGMWHQLGRPTPVVLCEIGPGRAALMHDMLRTIARLAPDLLEASQIAMVETSGKLTQAQRDKLSDHAGRIQWFKRFADIPAGPLLLVANELFDAIPIRQYVKTGGDFVERLVGHDDGGMLSFTLGTRRLDKALLPADHAQAPAGAIFETSPFQQQLMQEIVGRIASDRGAGLIIDYGHLQPGFADTLQAMLKHRYDDVFANPGQADLTSHVDFSALARIAQQAGCQIATATQGEFLLTMGLLERAGRLGAGRDAAYQQKITADVQRLAGPDQMGTLFKVLALSDADTQLVGFA